MSRWRPFPCASLLAAAAILLAAAGAAMAEDFGRTFAIAPPPSWVLPQGSLTRPTHGADERETYLLSDSQENVATGELYTNIVKELRTAEGVQDGSTISVDYDPSYQTLLFHRILVVRGGVVSSRLSRAAVRLIQREPDLESSMLDGAVTASFVLRDIRPGDRIDYAYTIRGRNPALGGRFADSFPYGWETALGRERVRVLCPTSRVLRYRSIGGTAQPRVSAKGSTTEYLWEFKDPAPILWEDQSPSWHVTYPWIEISEYPDWAAVDRWAQALYPPARLPAELVKLTARWSAEHAAPEDRLQAALDFVQQEVRYVAIELGTGSLTPRAPRTVWDRRFGDCKDKSYLLVSLLSRLGLEAAPVLVNTGDRTLVADRLPSPYDFDHVIVAVSVNGKRIFVDPTDAYQRGPVLKRFLPDYGYGLLLAPGQTQLLRFGSPQGQQPETKVVERFTSGGQDDPASLEVITTASGGAADSLRAAFATHTIEEVAKSYLNYYASDYPQIESVAGLVVRDDAAQDVLTTVERYRIPDFWTLLSDKRNYRASLFPTFVYGLIPMPKTKIRTSPIEVPYPRTVDERIEVSLPEPWPARTESATITTAAFELKTDYAARGTTIVLEHHYRSLADSIPVTAVPGYNEAVKDIDQRLGYRLTWQVKGAQGTDGPVDGSVMLILILSGLLLAAAAAGGYRLVTARSALLPGLAPAAASSDAVPPLAGPRGLGGWLVLVAIGLFLRPVLRLYVLQQDWACFTVGRWYDLTNPSGALYNPLWAPYQFYLIISSLLVAAASVLLLILFFQRRRRFPALFIGLLVLEALSVVATVMFTRALSTQTEQSVGTDVPGAVTQAVVGCSVWIPYMLSSRRVRNTFDR